MQHVAVLLVTLLAVASGAEVDYSQSVDDYSSGDDYSSRTDYSSVGDYSEGFACDLPPEQYEVMGELLGPGAEYVGTTQGSPQAVPGAQACEDSCLADPACQVRWQPL